VRKRFEKKNGHHDDGDLGDEEEAEVDQEKVDAEGNPEDQAGDDEKAIGRCVDEDEEGKLEEVKVGGLDDTHGENQRLMRRPGSTSCSPNTSWHSDCTSGLR